MGSRVRNKLRARQNIVQRTACGRIRVVVCWPAFFPKHASPLLDRGGMCGLDGMLVEGKIPAYMSRFTASHIPL